MVCPSCGAEVPDGYLLCEKCGAEIKIVPDFEPELENSITESLSGIAGELSPDAPQKEAPDESEPDAVDNFFRESPALPKRWLLFGAAGVLLAAALAVFIGFLYRNYSFSYQITKAKELSLRGDYDGALSYIARGKELRMDDVSVLLAEADIHISAGNTRSASDLLLKIIRDKIVDTDTMRACYDRMVQVYLSDHRYEELQALFLDCTDDELLTTYAEYLALPPEFSEPTGNYEDIVELAIRANAEGRIFYTLDESTPSDENGTLYTLPIRLNSGDYTVKAVFISQYGVSSEVTTGFYAIRAATPGEPVVTPESGDYDHPFYVTVEPAEGVSVYYTTDGSTPTAESGTLYEEPLAAQMGTGNFSFVAIDEAGKSSEVVKRSYNMYLGNVIAIPDAQRLLYQRFVDAGLAVDLSGYLPEGWGGVPAWWLLTYRCVVSLGGPPAGYYYIFDEYVIDANKQILNGAERSYAVEVYTGVCYRLTGDEKSLLPF